MTMPSGNDSNVTLEEVNRSLGDMRHEFRTSLATLVRTDVYRAEQSAMAERIKRLEQDVERAENERAEARRTAETEKAENRRLVISAFLTAGGTFAASLVMFFIALSAHH